MRPYFILATALLASCGGGSRGLIDSTERSADPRLSGYLQAFSNTCLANAPTFGETQVRSSFESQTGVRAVLTAAENKNCRFYVAGYGVNSPRPTRGDIAELAARLQSQVGGSAQWQGNSIRVDSPTGEYTVYAQADADGDFTMSVYK